MGTVALDSRMVMEIRVAVGKPTALGRLYPRHDEETDYLVSESRIDRDCPFGVDVHQLVIFDIDRQRILANVDLHVGRSLWVPEVELPQWPTPHEFGDLLFARETLLKKSFWLPLRARCDSSRQEVRVEVGDQAHDRVVGLSDDCSVLLRGDALVGFVARGFGGADGPRDRPWPRAVRPGDGTNRGR
jgi:hypothetical protein